MLDGPGLWPSLDGSYSEAEMKKFQAALDSIDEASYQSSDDEPSEDYIQRFQGVLDSSNE